MKKITILAILTFILFFYACRKQRQPTIPHIEPSATVTVTIMPSKTVTGTATAFTQTFTRTQTSTASVTLTDTPMFTLTATNTNTCTPTDTVPATATITPTILYKVDISLIHITTTANNSSAWIRISQNNTTPCTNAIVTVGGVNIPYKSNFFQSGSYMLDNVWIYVPGAQVYITIEIDGQTGYITTWPLPGGMVLAADALSVSWTSSIQAGEASAITILNGAKTITTYNTGLGLTSPHIIPQPTAYPTPGAYWMQGSMQNDLPTDYGVPGLIMPNSLLTCYEIRQYDIVWPVP